MERQITLPPEEVTLPQSGRWASLSTLAGGVGLVLLVAAFALGWGDKERLLPSYLVGFMYWLTFALGGLFFVIVHYVVRSGWSVVVRRLAEHVMMTLPLFAVLFVPIALGIHDLYHWSHADAVAHDPILQHKQVWLNQGAFLFRAVVYLAIWCGFAYFLRRLSMRQDLSGDLDITRRLQRWSALGAVLFAITFNFAVFDWLMSLEPHWFSTVYGVYIFAGTAIAIYSFLILLSLALQRDGLLKGLVTEEHYHDMAKLLFAFIVFWAYIGFSQFMLIWYANIPEETIWFEMRWQDSSWQAFSIFLAAAHFGLPFLPLLWQPVKRHRKAMTVAALWMLLMHYADIYWQVMPTFHDSFRPGLLDLLCWLGIGGLFLGVLGRLMQRRSLVPVGDPRLAESVAFESV